MDNEKLQRGNELVEAINEIKKFLEAFPKDSSQIKRCQIRVLYNFSPNREKSATIIADRIPVAFDNLITDIRDELARYEKEFEEL